MVTGCIVFLHVFKMYISHVFLGGWRQNKDREQRKQRKNGTKVEIVWRKEGSKDREVEVGGIPAFRQTIDDATSAFLSSFVDLQV